MTLSVGEASGQDSTHVPNIEMHTFDDGPGAQEVGDEWEDVPDEESISYVIRDVLDAQLVPLSLLCVAH